MDFFKNNFIVKIYLFMNRECLENTRAWCIGLCLSHSCIKAWMSNVMMFGEEVLCFFFFYEIIRPSCAYEGRAIMMRLVTLNKKHLKNLHILFSHVSLKKCPHVVRKADLLRKEKISDWHPTCLNLNLGASSYRTYRK